MARLGDGEGGVDRVAVAHLADQHDVGVLAKDVLQRDAEAVRVALDLTLRDEAALRLVQELDGVLERHDVIAALAVHLIDHGGERGALAASRRPGHQHQPAGQAGERRDGGRKPSVSRAGTV